MDRRITPEQIRECLGKVVQSQYFARSEQLKRLLRWLGERAAIQAEGGASEREVALEALGFGEDFDPRVDSRVRREMCRLREKVSRYYAQEGQADPMRIAFAGGYQLQFAWAKGLPANPDTARACLLILPARANEDLKEAAIEVFEELYWKVPPAADVDLVCQTTAMSYWGATGDVRAFALTTGATQVLEASLRRRAPVGDLVLTAWLVDGSNGRLKQSYRVSGADVFALADPVTEWLAGALRAKGA